MTKDGVSPFTSTLLTSNWVFKQGDRSSNNSYRPSNDLPTEIHRDLLKHGQIKDPFLDLDELSAHWVANESWTYCTRFDAPADYGKPDVLTYLKFGGLDTFATVWLNGQMILESDNMFVQYEVLVDGKLDVVKNNILEIEFQSARRKGLELVEKYQEHRFIVHQTEISRGPVRKAQYHWGWDWGPILLTCGPWKPISIETYVCKILDLSVAYELEPNLKSARVLAKAHCFGPLTDVRFVLTNNNTGETVVRNDAHQNGSGTAQVVEVSFDLKDVELWWPRGYGSQALYTISAEAYTSGASDSSHGLSKTIGFRKVELVQEPDTYGTSFYFRINNVDIFVGGSCWIPADSFLTRVTPDQYRAWIQLAADGNQNMLRVWGGGIYEADAFYESADELGILVWQDFMFACANYPTYPEYLKSVEIEARQNVRRLRHHPSVIIWAGNNEDYQIVERYSLEYDFDDKDPQSWLKTTFPARYIYEYLLPKIMNEESPGTTYHPSSPFGNGKSTTQKVDPTVGDVHQWNVWGGTMEPYQRLPEMGGRFVSEFGMEAYPHLLTLENCITLEDDRYPGSMTMDFHNKAVGHERRLMTYVAENFRIRYDLKGFTHLTQIMQADAMSWAYKGWRRQWGSGQGFRRCGGVLVWQLNDCWPTMSWAVVDYNLIPKPAYYAIKRAMAPVAVGVQRKFKPWTMRQADKLWQRDTGHVDLAQLWSYPEFDIWIANSTAEKLKVEVNIACYTIADGQMIQSLGGETWVEPNSTTVFLHDKVLPSDVEEDSNDTSGPQSAYRFGEFMVVAKLYIGGKCVSSDTAWPDPIKYLRFEDRGVEVSYNDNKSKIFVTAKRPVKGFVFSERQGVKLSDNGFDVVPHEKKQVDVTGCAADELKWMYVGMS